MPTSPTLILSSGGIRSLVATATVIAGGEAARVTILHIRDGRANAAVRREHVRRQAQHFRIGKLIELELPHIQTGGYTPVHERTEASPLVRPQVILAGLAQALELAARQLLWPVQVHGDHASIGRITEQLVLLQQLAQLEHPELPAIQTPLLDLSDRQMIELGTQLDVPWHLAWTCLMNGQKPCGLCAACKRRRAAFEAAGVVDATPKPAPVH